MTTTRIVAFGIATMLAVIGLEFMAQIAAELHRMNGLLEWQNELIGRLL